MVMILYGNTELFLNAEILPYKAAVVLSTTLNNSKLVSAPKPSTISIPPAARGRYRAVYRQNKRKHVRDLKP
jgi:hypothetical protein